MLEVFQGSEEEFDDHYDVTAFFEPDADAEEVTELIEADLMSSDATSTFRVSFLSTLFRAL